MTVVVRTHGDDFRIEGKISSSSLDMLKRHYGNSIHVEDTDGDDEWVNIEDTDWYREMNEKYTPASNIAFYRKEKKLTRSALGSVLAVSGKYVSDMEHGRLPVSKEMAKRVAEALDCPLTLFI